ncbi:putative membrane protein [Wickerhamomyces ciferrii]|uniref:Membrane protein n=1 Tax=Wickerhamomyces ciferrii (strain ATCC 14091 / BCRC 22168 / CBS 111 / JCM 3599 / NBRC 0793 / NRRL Y-1031 F-60-10) TaxID=1206466 RepID=K0KCN0_WICCF|nr:uncharacterized protein BN7_2375 [Wickerhamomyces ciferrii]CCH42830.1 putative membrane protein [Wickerhamomyces ciferrii]
MRLAHLILVPTLVTLVYASVFNETLNIEKKSQCFVLSEGHRVSVFLKEYQFSHLRDRVPDIYLLIYRKNQLNWDKEFKDQQGYVLKRCFERAIELGYCENDQYGESLYEFKTPQDDTKHSFLSLHIDELGFQQIEALEVEEDGYYCAQTEGLNWGTQFYVELSIDSGDNFTREEKLKFQNYLVYLIINIIIGIVFTGQWVNWKLKTKKSIPYLLKIIHYYLICNIVNDLLDLVKTWYGMNSKTIPGMILDNILAIFYVLTTRVDDFYYYHYSGEFTFNRPKSFESLKMFILLFFTSYISYLLRVTKDLSQDKSSLSYILKNLILALTYFLNEFSRLIFDFKIYLRYRFTSKQYYQNNMTDHPKLSQFKWLIMNHLFTAIFLVSNISIIGLLKSFLYYSENQSIIEFFLLDGEDDTGLLHWSSLMIFSILSIFDFYVFNFKFSPEAYEETINFKNFKE